MNRKSYWITLLVLSLFPQLNFASVKALKNFDQKHRLGDGKIYDAHMIWLKQSVGFWVDAEEYKILSDMFHDVETGTLRMQKRILEKLKFFVQDGPNDERISGLSRPELDNINAESGPCEDSRPLRQYEIDLFKTVFGNSLDTSRLRINNDGFNQAYHTVDEVQLPGISQIYLSCRGDWNDVPDQYVHEAAHAWQYQHQWPTAGRGGTYNEDKLAEMIRAGISFWDMKNEDQATTIAYALELEYFEDPGNVPEPWKSFLDKWIPIIQSMPPTQ